jgi:aspartate kinase
VVGEGIRYTPGIAASVFNALEGIRIRMISLGASRVNVGFVIDETDLQSAVQRLHATFFQSSPIRTDNTVERDS